MSQAPTLKKALSHHQAGQLVEARAGYKSVLKCEPNNINALHLLGVLENQTGQHEDAVHLIHRAIELQPNFAEAQNSLGNVYKEMGNWTEAEQAFRHAVEIDPRFAGAYLNLGLVARKQRGPEAALASYEKAIEIDPYLSKAHFNKANALREMNRLNEAVEVYRETLAQDPELTAAENNLGITLHDIGNDHFKNKKWTTAIKMYCEAITLGINSASLQNNLGSALKETGQIQEAIEAFGLALKCNPDYAAAHNNLGIIFEALGEFETALESYHKALKCDPEFTAALNNMGNSLRSLDRANEAISAYHQALTIDPNFPDALFNLGHAYKEAGEFEQAKLSYNRVLNLTSDHPGALRQLASLGGLKGRASDVPRLRAKLNDDMPDKDRIELAFALAKIDEDTGHVEEMFKMLALGNATKRKTINYDPVANEKRLQSIAEVFSSELLTKADGGYLDHSPIFIVGMPRSGTSLIEQILASHPDVFGAGELMHITNLAAGLDFPKSSTTLSPLELNRLGKTYIKQLRIQSKGAPRVTDKMPQNFLYLGFIRMILPNAKIIHCLRSPEDTCLSIYKTLFTDHIDFAYDLEELGCYFGHYARLMEHWRSIMPDGFLELSYEALIENQEYETRRLLNYLALPWNDSCLNFHKTIRRVTTASATQVRQKLYSESVGIWREYAAYLAPLLSAIPSIYRLQK